MEHIELIFSYPNQVITRIMKWFYFLFAVLMVGCESRRTKELKTEFKRLQHLLEENQVVIEGHKDAYTNLKNSGKEKEASVELDKLMQATDYRYRLIDTSTIIYNELMSGSPGEPKYQLPSGRAMLINK